MIELPRALLPWSSLLSLFAPELGPTFGAWVQRLSLAFGPMRARTNDEGGDPDGFDGIGRRGLYERLLTSEWLLATEAPDEFLRRAANGEHAFLQLARREPSGSRVSVALCDAGPTQLGPPRIAHLAALVALARRAEAAGAPFRWGVLQGDSGALCEGVTRANLGLLLASRSAREVSASDIDARLEAAGAKGKLDDLWFIGGGAIAGEASRRGASALELREFIEPGARALRARVVPASGSPKELSLELPEPAIAARLLRDPFSIAAAAPGRASKTRELGPDSNLFFSADSRRLLARLGQNGVISFPVPNSPRAQPVGKPTIYAATEGQVLSAAGSIGNRLVVVCESEQRYVVREVGKRGGNSGPDVAYPRTFAGAPRPGPLAQVFRLSDDTSKGTYIFRDAAGRLVRLAGAGSVGVLASSVLGVAQLDFSVRAALQAEDERGMGVRIRVFHGGEKVETLAFHLPDTEAPVHFGFGGWGAQAGSGGIAAVQHEAERWSLIVTNLSALEVRVPAESRVVGVIGPTAAGLSPGLLVLSRDEQSIDRHGQGGPQRILTAPAPIAHVAVSTSDMLIAYLTREGELVVHSFRHDAAVLRVLKAGA